MPLLSIDREGAVAIVTIDNPPVNALSRDLRQALFDAAEALDADASVNAVVLACAGRTFIAGADVNEFGRPTEPPHLPDVIARIERAEKPWIAAIHGSALGGGLEVALGCRFRIATSDASLGLPEVTLGLVPGSGGTVKTPRLIGMEAAVDLVTTGKPVRATRALKLGLVDKIAMGYLRETAIGFAAACIDTELPSPVSQLPVPRVADDFWAAKEAEIAKRSRGEAAPVRALACLKAAASRDFEAAMAFERETFLELRSSREAAALRHVFFAERGAPRPEWVRGVTAPAIKSAAVIGGGTMGAGIATALLNTGIPVTLLERDEDALACGQSTISGMINALVKRGRIDEDEAKKRLSRLSLTTQYDALADADLAIEAVFEDLAVKRDVFSRLNQVCRTDAILATNTSYLDPREIGWAISNPERFLGLHFFSPAHIMRLLEIVPLPETSPETLAAGFALAKALGKVPVQAGICEGFIGNRILKRYRAEAEALVRSGVPIATVDTAMRDFGFAMGPFEAQDLGGLDIAFLQRAAARQSGQEVPQTLGDILVDAGRKGQKTGGGWYDYRSGERQPLVSDETARLLAPYIVRQELSPGLAEIAQKLVLAMASEGSDILAEGIARQASDIDLVEIHGYGFPRRKGGPMFQREFSKT